MFKTDTVAFFFWHTSYFLKFQFTKIIFILRRKGYSFTNSLHALYTDMDCMSCMFLVAKIQNCWNAGQGKKDKKNKWHAWSDMVNLIAVTTVERVRGDSSDRCCCRLRRSVAGSIRVSLPRHSATTFRVPSSGHSQLWKSIFLQHKNQNSTALLLFFISGFEEFHQLMSNTNDKTFLWSVTKFGLAYDHYFQVCYNLATMLFKCDAVL